MLTDTFVVDFSVFVIIHEFEYVIHFTWINVPTCENSLNRINVQYTHLDLTVSQ